MNVFFWSNSHSFTMNRLTGIRMLPAASGGNSLSRKLNFVILMVLYRPYRPVPTRKKNGTKYARNIGDVRCTAGVLESAILATSGVQEGFLKTQILATSGVQEGLKTSSYSDGRAQRVNLFSLFTLCTNIRIISLLQIICTSYSHGQN